MVEGLLSRTQLYLVPFSHMDLFWLGEREECLSRGNRVIAEALRIARHDPRFHFLLEDGVFVADFLSCHPERREELTALIQEGRIEVGPKWAGIFQNLSDGESLIRNLALGVQFSQETFGAVAPTIHLGDLPGYTPQFPQILAKSGIRFAIITRSGPRDLPLFRWQSPDGTDVLTWNALDSYAWARNLSLHEGAVKATEKGLAHQVRVRLDQVDGNPILMHWGVDLILPIESLVDETERAAEETGLRLAIATPTKYFQALDTQGSPPILSGEIPSAWPFAEPAHLHAVGDDVTASYRLLAAERLTAVASALGYEMPSQSMLAEAWRSLLEAMDHNNDGQGWVGSARRKADFHQIALRTAEDTIRRATRPIAENVGGFPQGNAHGIVVFNPLAWERTEQVDGHITFYGNPEAFRAQDFRETTLVDERGQPIPYQPLEIREGVAREMHFAFTPQEVPSLGYRAYYFLPNQRPPAVQWPIESGDTYLATERYRLEVNPETATFDLHDLARRRPIAQGVGLVGLEEREDNYYFKTALTGIHYTPSLVDLKLVERGPVKLRWRAELRLADADFTLEFGLHAGLDRIDVDVRTDWEQSRPLRVLLRLPIALDPATLRYGVPFADIVYPEIMPETGPFRRDEIEREAWFQFREVQGWLDISDGNYGIGIASNRRAFELDPPTICPIVLRGSPSLRTVRVDGEKREYLYRVPEGLVHLSLTLYPHDGDWRQAQVYRRGWELNTPLVPVAVADPSSPKSLPPTQSFLSLAPSNLVVTALKREDSGGLLLRAYEATGQPARGELRTFRPLKGVRSASPIGSPGDALLGPLMVGPREIATWLLDL